MFTSKSRLMLIAPHPDDEALACSIILQHAVRAGASIHVLYATDGDNNPWPQRVFDRKWRLDAADRKRWGKLRRSEALTALHKLGVHPSNASFLALPDQGLTDLLTTDCRSTLKQFAKSICDWSPTNLLIPSTHDTHPDHNALAVMLRLVLAKLYPDESPMSVWTYAVHGNSRAFFDRAQELRQSKAEAAIKESAIRSHKTQLKLSRRRFLAYATRPERFLRLGPQESTHEDGPIRRILRHADVLRIKFQLSAKPMGSTNATFFVLGHDVHEALRCVQTRVPLHSSAAEIFDCHTNERFDVAQYRGNTFSGEFAVPAAIFSPAHALFVKLARRSWFFDEAGWLESPPIVQETTPARMAKTRSMRRNCYLEGLPRQ
jgi:LmbE family N-acetylglucosaminyl deacetylase